MIILYAFNACTTKDAPCFEHKIKVPAHYQWGSSIPSFQSNSKIKTYISSYEKGWWQCILKFKDDINYIKTASDGQYIGSAEHIDGAMAGYNDAYFHTIGLIKKFGSEKVKKTIEQAFNSNLQ